MIYHTITNPDDDYIWNLMLAHSGEIFYTARGLPFTYHQKVSRTGEPLGELVIDRKEKTITRNTVLLAYQKALKVQETEGSVSGPKKLGVFGASYLYPVFLSLGICRKETSYLVETKAPAGYIMLTEPLMVTIDMDGTIYGQRCR